MPDKPRVRERGCNGKVKHETRIAATRAMLRATNRRRQQGRPSVYKCVFCGYYHWGHQS